MNMNFVTVKIMLHYNDQNKQIFHQIFLYRCQTSDSDLDKKDQIYS